jgi:predicted O-linked N-acetylglucosamine transferase (SPINDLY family)
MMISPALDMRLLTACARVITSKGDEAAIRRMLVEDVDWGLVARKAIAYGLDGLVGNTLIRVAPDMVPEDVLDSFRANMDQKRRHNRRLFEQLAGVIDVLISDGVEAMPLDGPVFIIEAYGDLGFRECRGMHFLIRDSDLASAIVTLRRAGYVRQGQLTAGQFELIHRLQGHEVIINQAARTAIVLHTRLIPSKMALDIDYAAFWQRARRPILESRSILMAAPEDDFSIAAILSSKEMWGNIRLACDAAAFIASHPQLDWIALAERAHAQGCLRIVLVATALARKYFDAAVPDGIVAAEVADPNIESMVGRIAARWQADDATGQQSDGIPAMDRARLHDGIARQARYAARTVLLPKPHHVSLVPLPRGLPFAYVPIKIAHDAVALPLWRAYKMIRARAVERTPAAKADKADKLKAAFGPQNANAWALEADRFFRSRRFTEAAVASDRALALDPEHVDATRIGINSRILACDWRRREDDKRRISAGLSIGQRLVGPLNHRAICSSEAEHLVFAQLRATELSAAANPLWQGEAYRHDKIRIAYLSTDYRDHVLSSAIVGCFEHHDKTRFEITAISLGPDDGSEMRRRVEAAFDSFIDVQAMSDAEVAKTLRERETDIAIEQNGYSGNGRPGILSHRPAPVQVNYLAYPGTMGAPFIDYIIADRLMIPDENRMFYTEQVVYLPHTYLPTDNKRPIAEITPSRAEAGLPETGFVFVCNNNAHKIGPEMFDIWMRLLQAVEGSVLWLKTLSPSTMINLRREAKSRGISPERLVFAPEVPDIGDHLARLRLADLFLDTLPYNAHATASDALWAGLPVLTCLGHSFPAGVAAGVLHSVGLHELVTKSLAEYEEQALALARNPERLAAIKAKLVRNRDTAPLFDTARFTRDLESAYTVMWERTQRGEPPESFFIES